MVTGRDHSSFFKRERKSEPGLSVIILFGGCGPIFFLGGGSGLKGIFFTFSTRIGWLQTSGQVRPIRQTM